MYIIVCMYQLLVATVFETPCSLLHTNVASQESSQSTSRTAGLSLSCTQPSIQKEVDPEEQPLLGDTSGNDSSVVTDTQLRAMVC